MSKVIKADERFFKVPVKILLRQQLWRTQTGRKRKNDCLAKFYLCVFWYTRGGQDYLTRKIKRSICAKLKIRKSQFWTHWGELDRLGYAEKQAVIPYNPGTESVKPEFRKYLKRPPVSRKVVRFHRYLNPIECEKWVKLPHSINGISVLKKHFNLLAEIEDRLKNSMHRKEIENNPDQFTFPFIHRSTRYRCGQRHKELIAVASVGRDISNKLLIKNTEGDTLRLHKGFLLLVLLERHTESPVRLSVPWYQTKKVIVKGRKFYRHRGRLWLKWGDHLSAESGHENLRRGNIPSNNKHGHLKRFRPQDFFSSLQKSKPML